MVHAEAAVVKESIGQQPNSWGYTLSCNTITQITFLICLAGGCKNLHIAHK
jgi:hypothetical protein